MKKYKIAVHFDMVKHIEVIAESLGDACTEARRKADTMECSQQDCEEITCGLDSWEPQELTPRELRRMENEQVVAFVSGYVEQQPPTEVKDIADGYGVNWVEFTGEDETEFYNSLFQSISDCKHPRTAIFDRYVRMYARQRWEEVVRMQAAEWDEAFQKARQAPKTYRVIVETNEREEETGDGDRYFMIDRWEPLSGTMLERWHVIRCDCAASPYDTRTAKAYTVGTQEQPSCEASPENVTRWAHSMIHAGRVVDIYADCY